MRRRLGRPSSLSLHLFISLVLYFLFWSGFGFRTFMSQYGGLASSRQAGDAEIPHTN